MNPTKRKVIAKNPEKNSETVTLSTDSVSVVSEAKAVRITYNEADMPVTEFLGSPWTGKDVSRIVASIPRAYRTYKLNVRRQGVTK